MPKNPRISSSRLHKGSGQAVVILGGKSAYLGRWNSSQSRVEYERVIAEWLAYRQRPVGSHNPGTASPPTPSDTLTVNELILHKDLLSQGAGWWRVRR